CACSICKADQNVGCTKPFLYQEEEIKLLNCLYPKWDPRHILHESKLALNADEQEEHLSALANQKPVIFDPNITVKSDLSLTVRAFVSNPRSKRPADQMYPIQIHPPPELTIFVAGTIQTQDDGEQLAGGGIWLAPDDLRNKPVAVPKALTTRGSRALAAILYI
ncbi:hypothetical protein B0H13DRAFT_1499564, partial [Mycena leptocephala]